MRCPLTCCNTHPLGHPESFFLCLCPPRGLPPYHCLSYERFPLSCPAKTIASLLGALRDCSTFLGSQIGKVRPQVTRKRGHINTRATGSRMKRCHFHLQRRRQRL
jgi:hypothetical protein